MDAQRIIESTRERESEFFYRMAQHLGHKADEATDAGEHGPAYAYRQAADLLEQAATKLMMESR